MEEKLIRFFHALDRSYFIEGANKVLAPFDRPVPIGYGQTISQPSLVLYMSDALQLNKDLRVLEIGTGSGYQSVFLAEFAKEVYTVELIEDLSRKARKRLEHLSYHNIHYKIGDGSLGWKEYAPYDRIMVTAAPRLMPHELIEQLAPTGIMILPLGPGGNQVLMHITKDAQGVIHEKRLLDVSFVELVGAYT
ncbi:MAG: protein-L-isoaspartate(D-aspartate) O-methyltransferase [Sphaerochaetaceae bacterium]|nr:protein-L-isoaspartate(D-aspartate) O-methyltransferase [Sphaerochaetaceae bacterium]